MSETILNPLLSGQPFTYNNYDELHNEYECLYILSYVENNEPINDAIYYYMIDKELYNNISKNIILIKTNLSLLKLSSHNNKITILPKHILDKFNYYNYFLKDKNLVLTCLNISYNNIQLYLTQFNNTNKLENIFKLISLNKYFNNDVSNFRLNSYFENTILNLIESDYWTNNYNCRCNLTSFFSSRIIKYNINIDNKVTTENYLKNIYKNNNYVDPSKILVNTEFYYKMNTFNMFTKSDIYNLLYICNEKQKYLLFCNLLISKSYCHLVLNNKDVLVLMKPIINKFCQLFRYLIGYAWLRFYFEESLKKTWTTKDDQFIFDIDTASELPYYPFSIECPKLNPYMTILVSDVELNSTHNIGGIGYYKYHKKSTQHTLEYGIANLSEFRKNLNVFCTGKSNINLFENVNWTNDKIALSGSVMCACIQKYHPLMHLFLNYPTFDEQLKRFYNEYYAKSDIDVMFLTDNTIDFINKVNKFHKQIIINICKNNSYAEEQHIKLICEKQVFLFITDNHINNIIKTNSNITKDEIINNLEDDKIKDLFLDILNTQVEKYKKQFLSNISDSDMEYYCNTYPEYINFDQLTYKLRLAKTQNDTELNIAINFKYKIKSPYLDYPLELFMVKYNDFFATVQTFHLPCVRAYYNGDNVYMTPSCITAHMTYINVDYKYFTGSCHPIEIINKYRMRGFGTWLNENEKVVFVKYSVQSEFWNNLYSFQMNNITSIKNNLGSLIIKHKLFLPRLYNIDYYNDDMPIDISIGYNDLINIKEVVLTENTYFDEINYFYNNTNVTILDILKQLQTINEKGFINPIEKSIIMTMWEFNKINNLPKKKKINSQFIINKVLF
jgi:hypothetical protein